MTSVVSVLSGVLSSESDSAGVCQLGFDIDLSTLAATCALHPCTESERVCAIGYGADTSD